MPRFAPRSCRRQSYIRPREELSHAAGVKCAIFGNFRLSFSVFAAPEPSREMPR